MRRPSDEQIIEALDLCLTALWKQQDALQRLAMHYPEAHHVLSNPRKPDSIIILERLRHAMTAPTAEERPSPGTGERGGE